MNVQLVPPQPKNMEKIKCGLCDNMAEANILYHSPGDFDEDNLAPLIPLCSQHTEDYSKSGYPEPLVLKSDLV